MGKSYSDYETLMREFTFRMKSNKRLEKQHLLKKVSDRALWATLNKHQKFAQEYIWFNNYRPFPEVRRYELVAFYYTIREWKQAVKNMKPEIVDREVGSI